MKVLIIGLGSIGKKHVAALRSINPSIQIDALRSSKSNVELEGVVNYYEFNEIKQNKYDFAIISNPTSEHKRTIEQVVQLNIPLFIEKPLFHNLDIEDLVKNVISHNITTYVACNLRFLNSLIFLKKYLTSNSIRINEINVYCGSYLPDWRKDTDYKNNYSAIPELGGGVHIDLIHEIDYLYWFFGMPNNTHRFFSNKSSLNITAYDYANYILEYQNFNVNIILNYFRRDAKRTCEIVLEDLTLTANLLENKIVDSNQKIIFESEQKMIETYKNQLEYFIACIKNNSKPFNTIEDAYNLLKICLNS